MTTWVKICGVTRVDDALAAFAAGADAIGLNFWPGSKRHCEEARAREIVAALPAGAMAYGVFVRMPRAGIERIVAEVGLGGVQLHGGEPVEEARGWSVPVLRAVAATSREAVARALGEASGHRLLVDSAAGGGSGTTVEGDVLAGLDLGRAVLAGGLTPANVAASVARFAPWGVDVAGGVEAAPGIKDARLVEAFVREARRGPATAG